MLNLSTKTYLKILIPILTGIGLLFIPLLGDFHIESALLVSLVGCFWAGIRACSKQTKSDFFSALRVGGYLFLAGFPLLIKAILTGCFSIDGLAFWLIFPLPSVFFGYAIGRLLRIWNLPFRRMLTVAILLAVAVGIFLFELLTYPQVYFFNHVWGAWPGPIYDEVIRVNGATVFFRCLTVFWSLFIWQIPNISCDKYSKWIVGFAAVAILLSYTNLTEFGVISPRSHLQNVLGGHKTTEHFELYYDQDFYSDYEINLLTREHEFYLDRISDQLDLPERDSTDKIESYLYAHPWQKKQLVGAKFTSYVPVWLGQDQLHIARQQIPSSLQHELVHVLAKQFGNDLFNASWSTGLIEGIAVAIDGGSSPTSTIDQIVVSEKPYPNAEELQQAFSPWGFYGGRSGVNYITSGSFVRFLLQNYPVESLKKAYRTGNPGEAYTKNWNTLTKNWHQHLDSIQVDTLDRQVAGRIFGFPSLFEQECPHVVSDFAIAFDSYRFHQANRDTAMALQSLDDAVAEAGSVAPVKAEWSYQHLVNGDPQLIQQAASLQDTTVDLQLLFADAFAMNGDWNQTQRHIQKAQQLFAQNPDSLLEPALVTRMNRRQWEIYRQMTYHNELPDSTTFAEAYYRTKIRSLRKAIEQERWTLLEVYSKQLLTMPLHERYFDEYLLLIHHAAFRGDADLADRLMEKVSAMPLRDRYRERLLQEQEWLMFMTSRAH